MSTPFHQIIPYVENALADIRGRGMGGNIVRDPDSVQSYPYRASWTGQEYIFWPSRAIRRTTAWSYAGSRTASWTRSARRRTRRSSTP